MSTASQAAKELSEARKVGAERAGSPVAEARMRQLRDRQEAEFHGPTTAMLDAMQPFNIEGGEGQVHQMAARHARVAIKQALEDAGGHLLKAGDLRPLVRKHPWWFAGGAVALGVVAAGAVAVARSRGDKPSRRAGDWAWEQAMQAEVPPRRPGAKRRTVRRVLQVGWRLTRPAVFALISGAVAQATSKASSAPTGVDGSAGPAPGTDQAEGGGNPFDA